MTNILTSDECAVFGVKIKHEKKGMNKPWPHSMFSLCMNKVLEGSKQRQFDSWLLLFVGWETENCEQ